MQLTISTQDGQIILATPLETVRIKDSDSQIENLQNYCNAYQECRNSNDQNTLLTIGEQLFKAININQSMIADWLNDVGSHQLEILADPSPDKLQSLLLNLPWEIMAVDGRFLANDNRLYEVSRRIGEPNPNPPEPQYKDLTLAFMAADPDFNSGLQYEQEEQAILLATRTAKNLNLMVDDTGNLDYLTRRILDSGHCDIAHLSCHGRIDPQKGFVLCLENDRFGLQEVTANDFLLLSQHINCLFLSACNSAKSVANETLSINLAGIGIANVIGWDGSVADSDASHFASIFYKALLHATSVTMACALARRQSLQSNRMHWHLGRCYLGPKGGTPLIAPNKPKSPKRRGRSCHDLLDKAKKQIQVASKETFVGRRWQTKQALLSFSQNQKAGVLLYGIGGTGKSSLAARIVDRLEPQYKAVVIYQHYNPFDILTSLQKAAHHIGSAHNFVELIDRVRQDPQQLADILFELLEGIFCQFPIVLVIDDLEQHILEPLQQGQEKVRVKSTYQNTLAAIIGAFDHADTESRLLLTSRYPFSLPDSFGDELADRLQAIVVPDMTEVEQERHWIALLQTDTANNCEQERDNNRDNHYLARIFAVCQGNPGLQDVLFAPLLKGENDTLGKALERIENYQADRHPQSSKGKQKIDIYLQRIALETYSKALSDSEHSLLRVMTLFDFPIPQGLVHKAALKLGIDQPKKMLDRLDNFGLLNHWQGKGLEQHISCFSLARKVVELLSQEDRHLIATVCAPLLWQIWFRDFLRQYQIEPTETLKESIEKILHGPFPPKYKGILPLSSELDQQRIGSLHRLCIYNSSVDWLSLGFDPWNFLDLFEQSLSLSTFEKLLVSAAGLDGFTEYQWTTMHDVFAEERLKFQELAIKFPQDIITLLMQQFSGRPKLLRQSYQLYFDEHDQMDMIILDSVDADNQESQYIVAEKLAKTPLQKAGALRMHANFLADQKQDYDAAEVMYKRAIEAEPKQANNLGNYAQVLFVARKDTQAKKMLEQAENQQDLEPNVRVELAFYRYAHCAPYKLQSVKRLLLDDARSIDWRLDGNVQRAVEDLHPQPELLAAIANVISGEQPIATLNQFSEWKKEV